MGPKPDRLIDQYRFFIGGYGPDEEYTQNRHFNGIIDEVRVSDVALTEDEIRKSMEGFAAVSSDGKLPAIWAKLKCSDYPSH